MKTLRLYFILWALASLLLSCDNSANHSFELDNPDDIPAENYEIYSLVLKELYDVEQVVISQTSLTNIELQSNSSFYDILVSKYPDFDIELVTDLNSKNQESVLFANYFNAYDKEIILLSEDENKHIFDGSDLNKSWSNFYKAYSKSNGIVSLSQIGFNSGKSQAVFEIGHVAASLAGGGSIIYLKKVNNQWVVIDILYTWVS